MRILFSEKGVTLVELLAALVLVTIIATMSWSIFMSGQKTVSRTVAETNSVNDLRFALSIVGEDVRGASTISYRSGELALTDMAGTTTYKIGDDGLLKDGQTVAYGVDMLGVTKEADTIVIKMRARGGTESEKQAEMAYTLREGVRWE